MVRIASLGTRNSVKPPAPRKFMVIDGTTVGVVGLTKGYEAIVDIEDYDRVMEFKWSSLVCRRRNGGDIRTVYATRNVMGRQVMLHRFVLGLPRDTSVEVDHRDHDGLNNRRSNLRPCTTGQNNANMRPQIRSLSRLRGVHWEEFTKCWRVQIAANGKRYRFGRYHDPIVAAKVYNAAASWLFGDFAYLNEVPND
jgi:hypothetical protein